VEGAQRLDRVADHEYQGVRDRPHGIGLDQLRRLRHRDAVAATHEGVALDHGRDAWVHPARAEADDLALAGGFLAAGGLRRDPGRLTEQAEQRGLVLRPVDVDALDG
jgi:hypothetical protein